MTWISSLPIAPIQICALFMLRHSGLGGGSEPCLGREPTVFRQPFLLDGYCKQLTGADGRHFRTRFLPMTIKKGKGGSKPTGNEVKVDGISFGSDIAPDNVIEGVIGIIMDVTEVKAKEAVLEAQAKERQQLLANEAAAKEASRLKSQFLANVSSEIKVWADFKRLTYVQMSHEIRTPITGVIGRFDCAPLAMKS